MTEEEMKILAEKYANGTATIEEKTAFVEALTLEYAEIKKMLDKAVDEDKIEQLKEDLSK